MTQQWVVEIIVYLQSKFSLNNLGRPKHIIILAKICLRLEETWMLGCKLVDTPSVSNQKYLLEMDSDLVDDASCVL